MIKKVFINWLSNKIDNLILSLISKADPSDVYTGVSGSASGFKYTCYQCGYTQKTNSLGKEGETKVNIQRSFHSLLVHGNATPLIKGILYKFGWTWEKPLI